MTLMILPALHTVSPLKPFIKDYPIPIHRNPFSSCEFSANARPTNTFQQNSTRHFYGPIKKFFNVKSREFTTKAQTSSGFEQEEEELKARGQSSMPDRFRPLTKEVPDKPVRWPWFIVAAFMLYAWRTVLWELSNWKTVVVAIGQFLQYLFKFILAFVFHFIGDPITSLIRGIETLFYTIRAFYSGIIAYAPIPELTLIITLTSAVLSVAEVAAPDSVSTQRHLLTIAGLIGFAAVKNYISELFFWTLLLGLFGYARLIEKKDYVHSALPLAAVLAGVGEPWVRVTTMASYTALAIFHRFKRSSGLQEDKDGGGIRVPVPLLCAALAIGIRIAAKWAGYRHLTWMIV